MPASNSTSFLVEPDVRIKNAEVQVWYIILGIPTILLAGFGNLGTIIAFFTEPNLNTKPSDLIILNLAFADLGMAIFTIPIFQVMVGAYGYWPWGETPCRVLLSIGMVLIFAGVLFIILMSWDRYMMLALQYSDYLKKMSYKRVKIVIGITWFAAMTQALYEAATWDTIIAATPVMYRTNFDLECDCPSMKLLTATWFCALIFSVIPVIAIVLLGGLILANLRKRLMNWKKVGFNNVTSISGNSTKTTSLDVHNGKQANPSVNVDDNSVTATTSHASEQNTAKKQHTVHKRYVKPILTYTVLVLSLTACTLPLYIYIIYVNLNCQECYDYFTAGYFFGILFFNSALNPVLYALTNSKIRGFYVKKYNAIRRWIADR